MASNTQTEKRSKKRKGFVLRSSLVREENGQAKAELPSLCPITRIDQKAERPKVAGKFIFIGKKKFYIKGVSYGAFRPDSQGREYQDLEKIRRDFKMMAEHGFNVVRIPHTVPPRILLDIAAEFGLRVMVGLSAEQYVGYLIDRKDLTPIFAEMRQKVWMLSNHPALLCYALGNEIPAPLARWVGHKKIENYLRRLYKLVKAVDPEGLVTYVNYPTVEYLELPFLDFVCFNVYLESQEKLEAYIARLQNIAGERPLILSEVGLDSMRNGEEKQADILEWQIRTSFHEGCGGIVIFSWTDEWFRGGGDVDDWAFGLTDIERQPKPSLRAVEKIFREGPFSGIDHWPRIAVVVCSYNGQKTIQETCDRLLEVEYPDFEVIVVNDGSVDNTPKIAVGYEFRVISRPNNGLSRARNIGYKNATGEIVAYIDDDAYPDPHWLHYLALEFMKRDYAAVGGHNIPPPGDGPIAECVGNSPGGPAHVLYSDRLAEHIPGCNMAYRKSALEGVQGFDTQYRVAGDDVDMCWRILEMGWKIGFSHSAMVWHHRRNSVKTYWKQQVGYGRAEALLEAKWPERFNGVGHLSWAGRVYYKGLTLPLLFKRSRIYQGIWGTAPFQSIYKPSPNMFASLVLMPEWYMIIGVLGLFSVIGFFWKPLELSFVFLGLAFGAVVLQSALSGRKAVFTTAIPAQAKGLRFRLKCLTALMHLMQPFARLWGRIKYGLTFWRRLGPSGLAFPKIGQKAVWTENWIDPILRLESLAKLFQEQRFVVKHGGDYDNWDLEIGSGMFGGVRILMAIEDHGSGTQYVRVRWEPTFSKFWGSVTALLGFLSAAAAFDQSWIAAAILGGGAALVAGRILWQCSCAMAGVKRAIAVIEKTNA